MKIFAKHYFNYSKPELIPPKLLKRPRQWWILWCVNACPLVCIYLCSLKTFRWSWCGARQPSWSIGSVSSNNIMCCSYRAYTLISFEIICYLCLHLHELYDFLVLSLLPSLIICRLTVFAICAVAHSFLYRPLGTIGESNWKPRWS